MLHRLHSGNVRIAYEIEIEVNSFWIFCELSRYIGGPGGGKTRHAERVRDALADTGLVHICMPDLIRNAIAKYKDRYPEWKEAALRYHRGKFLSLNQVIIMEIIYLI